MGTAIMNLSPRVNHPVRAAERVAMMDHLTGNRFEWGTGRGAGSHEIASFNIMDKNSTKAEWEEVAPQIPRMWEQKDYEFHGESFEVPYPHNILPKPYGKGHPPIWMACGNPPSFGRAGELGIGAIAFNFEPIHNLKGRVDAYKEAIANCTEPLGSVQERQHHDDQRRHLPERPQAGSRDRPQPRPGLPQHDGGHVPRHDAQEGGCPVWPQPPYAIPDEDVLDQVIAAGSMLCGTPEEVGEQLEAYQNVGCDQVVFGFPPEGATHEENLEMIELFGKVVRPSSTRTRCTRPPATARPRCRSSRCSTTRCRTSARPSSRRARSSSTNPYIQR